MQAWYSPEDLERMSARALTDLARSHLVPHSTTFPVTVAAEILRRAALAEGGQPVDAVTDNTLLEAASDRMKQWLAQDHDGSEEYSRIPSSHHFSSVHH